MIKSYTQTNGAAVDFEGRDRLTNFGYNTNVDESARNRVAYIRIVDWNGNAPTVNGNDMFNDVDLAKAVSLAGRIDSQDQTQTLPQQIREVRDALCQSAAGTRYTKFICNSVSSQQAERAQITKLFGDSFAATFTGREPVTVGISGKLPHDYSSAGQMTWYAAFKLAYEYLLRASRLAYNRCRVRIVIPDTAVYEGYIVGFTEQLTSSDDMFVPFTIYIIVTHPNIILPLTQQELAGSKLNDYIKDCAKTWSDPGRSSSEGGTPIDYTGLSPSEQKFCQKFLSSTDAEIVAAKAQSAYVTKVNSSAAKTGAFIQMKNAVAAAMSNPYYPDTGAIDRAISLYNWEFHPANPLKYTGDNKAFNKALADEQACLNAEVGALRTPPSRDNPDTSLPDGSKFDPRKSVSEDDCVTKAKIALGLMDQPGVSADATLVLAAKKESNSSGGFADTIAGIASGLRTAGDLCKQGSEAYQAIAAVGQSKDGIDLAKNIIGCAQNPVIGYAGSLLVNGVGSALNAISTWYQATLKVAVSVEVNAGQGQSYALQIPVEGAYVNVYCDTPKDIPVTKSAMGNLLNKSPDENKLFSPDGVQREFDFNTTTDAKGNCEINFPDYRKVGDRVFSIVVQDPCHTIATSISATGEDTNSLRKDWYLYTQFFTFTDEFKEGVYVKNLQIVLKPSDILKMECKNGECRIF